MPPAGGGDDDQDRPRTRADCRHGPRPCPWVACKHHLYLDVNPETGSIKLNFGDMEVSDMEESCTLDVAERGVHTLDFVSELMNITKTRVLQIERTGCRELARLYPDLAGVS